MHLGRLAAVLEGTENGRAISQRRRRLPGCVVARIAPPFNQVLLLAAEYPGVEDGFDFKFGHSVDDIRRGTVVLLGVD